jgi:hypothetical protein
MALRLDIWALLRDDCGIRSVKWLEANGGTSSK